MPLVGVLYMVDDYRALGEVIRQKESNPFYTVCILEDFVSRFPNDYTILCAYVENLVYIGEFEKA